MISDLAARINSKRCARSGRARAHLQWSDGISLSCQSSLVQNNDIVDATDGGESSAERSPSARLTLRYRHLWVAQLDDPQQQHPRQDGMWAACWLWKADIQRVLLGGINSKPSSVCRTVLADRSGRPCAMAARGQLLARHSRGQHHLWRLRNRREQAYTAARCNLMTQMGNDTLGSQNASAMIKIGIVSVEQN